ncbi:hypothetical protein M422DRAFT_272791 [Sphaerobolus stellatus SS14]|uniref:Uncharacterized protein n=1 Tax=Sphaerobolus stellatus (strain SS14) TaxID=990650 RepID=A0A0C9ULL0_SPHS4|nr:hypothetical protein M422DRAFT_272791 [Sphaerobolus stellatus SS14]
MLSGDKAMSSLHSGPEELLQLFRLANKLFLVPFDLCVATAVQIYREQRIGTHGIRSSAQMAYDLRITRNNAAYDDTLARILSTTKDGDERGNQHGRGRGGRGRGRGRGRGGGIDPARDDNDNELASRRARGRGRPRGRGGGRGRGAPAVPEDTLDEEDIREIREQQRENRLAKNAREQEADEIARFLCTSSSSSLFSSPITAAFFHIINSSAYSATHS